VQGISACNKQQTAYSRAFLHVQTYIFTFNFSLITSSSIFQAVAAKASSRIQLRRLPFPVIAASLGHSSTVSQTNQPCFFSRHQPCDPPRKSSPAHTIPPCSNNIIFALAYTHLSSSDTGE
jgi:hypothetical protein